MIRTTPVRIAVATATAAADGYQPGDISIVFSDQLVGELEDLANVACAGGAKLKTRQACSASGAGRFVEGAAGPGGLMEDVFLNGFPKITIPAGDVANALQKMIAAGKILAAYESVAAVAALWLSIKLELGPKQIIQVHKNDVSSASTTKPPSPITSSSTACPTGANAVGKSNPVYETRG